ncbi:CheY-like chemotaxis protein [Paraburkholderia sp. BL18I3N2]|uniref:response regulator n=1 Tax=Paraburkholderia sp. BL18I3N2 TaxID=1938799 RepID=UPI000D06BCA5|nr:response regulator [Paraburkholderia sp. BL18I3N2]PRX32182.1 CheY-like chemotaxis protein [Paraburkholderia sp. BL18I3N2]
MDGTDTDIRGRRILVIEDDFLVAQALCSLIEEAGATVVGPLGWLGEALAYVESNKDQFDSAVLDVDLHGEKSYALADWLAERNVRFVFTTGYGADALDPAYSGYPRCEKPFDPRALFRALASRNP